MNSLDLPAPPPEDDLLRLSECATFLLPMFAPLGDDETVAHRMNQVLDRLRHEGYMREWGFDANGRTLYYSDNAFAFDPNPRTVAGVHYIRIQIVDEEEE